MKRRRFVFWLGMGMFGLAERLRADGLDHLAAAMMRRTEPAAGNPRPPAEHWTANSNRTWRWFERETLVKDQWKLTGITTPVHKRTGELLKDRTGYLDESLVPEELLRGSTGDAGVASEPDDEHDHGRPNATRRARHGRPPSKWLRSLHADELRIWLRKVDVPEAGVLGMTYFEHLTRDHSFEPVNVRSLSIDEQAKLHGAAHYGY